MGRPLNKKYFANTNYQDFGTANVGGESVDSVTIGTPVSATFTTATATFSAPQISGGAAATGTVTLDGDGDIVSISVNTAGSGYTSIPTITVSGAGNADVVLTSGSDTVTIALTSGASARQNGIKCEAQVPTVGEATTGDIIRQVSTRRYKVSVGGVIGICKLVSAADLSDNEMTITATDANSNAYWVTKLTAHKATLTRKSSGSGDFSTGAAVKWTFTSPAPADSVTIENQ